ncbi:MAG: hypothetical protein CMP49_00725 [Flavobacteriales bacterium]|nr:hypothetical protein [Flavobacteriales bacterium]|tara:strand:- start:30135 stop:31643 length:1509 start_codon:yes stop_codon:yes gene_type:complete
MVFKKTTLRLQIFLSMIGLITFALLIVAIINIQQTRKDTEQYNSERLARKDRAVAKSIEAIINISPQYNVDLETSFKPILKDVGYIHNLKINIYNLRGKFIWSSDSTLLKDSVIIKALSQTVIDSCFRSVEKKINYEKGKYFGTYRILYQDHTQKNLSSSEPIITDSPFCILDVIYDKSTKDDIIIKTNQQIKRLIQIYILLLLFAVGFAYLLLQQITSPLRSISRHLSSSKIDNIATPLHWPVKDEIGHLIEDYNKLMKELEVRTQQLINSEKEGAWKKMAKQIAHEIKNPLTPMRLNVQYLLKSFVDGEGVGLYSDEWKEKLQSFSKTMIQQIDTLTRIANDFSDFASLNIQSEEKFELAEEVERIVHLFKNNNVKYQSLLNTSQNPKVFIDKSHLTRVLNNLIKNSLQAEKENTPIEVLISLKQIDNFCLISVKDNGKGISKDINEKIFEPNFTTKNSGMGLGLAIVKKIINDFNGTINYKSSKHGTIFILTIPLINKK